MHEYIQFATELAREAGEIVQMWQRRGITTDTKSSVSDLVTEADHAADAHIIRRIRARYPDHDLLTEESGAEVAQGSRWRWLIDPLDGTTNFAQDIPHYCVSIALTEEGRIVMGVLYDPVRDELFSAMRGGGAWLDAPAGRRRLAVSQTDALEEAVLATGFAYQRATTLSNNLQEFQRVVLRIRGMRRMGSAALDLAYVAAGRLDGYWEYHLNPWDTAAGALLVEEAGGVLCQLDGSPWHVDAESILATSPQLLPILQETLTKE